MYKLKNGLNVILKPTENLSTTFQITFHVGSIDETEAEKGYSHLIEHLLFEGTKKRADAKIINSEIENLGGEFNAGTSNESTTFYIKLLSKHHQVALDLLSDIVLNSTFNQFEKEKKVVLEEIKMLLDNPRYYQWILFEKILFENTNYGYPVYGNIENVKNATKEKLKAYYKKYYVPTNATLTVVGNIPKNLDEEIKKKFENWTGTVKKINQKIPFNKKRVYEEKRDIQQIYLTYGLVAPNTKHPDSPTFEVIEAILGKTQSGTIIDEVRNKRGLAYDISVSYESFINFGFFAINAGLDEKNKAKTIELIEEQLNKIKSGNFSNDDIKNAISHIEGRTLLEKEDTHRHSEMLTFWYLMEGKDREEEYLNLIKKVKKEDIIRVAKKYFTDKTTIVTLSPKNRSK